MRARACPGVGSRTRACSKEAADVVTRAAPTKTPAPGPPRPSLLHALMRPAERGWSAVLVLLALCGFLFFYGLRAGELYRTEGLRAIIAAEFLHSGNWIVPSLYGEPLFTKPPGMYAAIALVSWPLGGITDWSARLPSALAATATVLLFYWYFGRQLGRLGGLAAAVILPLSPMWLDKASAAEIDMLQAAWVAGAIVFFLRALETSEEGKRKKAKGKSEEGDGDAGPGTTPSVTRSFSFEFVWWLAALLCVAGGVLTKWTAPVFFYATVVPLLWWRGRLRLLFGWRHLVSAGLAASLCLGWAGWAAALGGWDVLVDTVGREAMQRLWPSYHQEVMRQMAPHHQAPLYLWGEMLLHPFKLLGMNLPWSVLALLTLRPGFAGLWDERGRRLLQALHCWTWPNILFWSIIPEHAPRHSFPLFPGIAGLAALAWIQGKRKKEKGKSSESDCNDTLNRLIPPQPKPAWLSPLSFLRPVSLFHLVILWLVVKVVFVELVIPRRGYRAGAACKGGAASRRSCPREKRSTSSA